ncbi:cullin-like protein, partial [Trifolium medium]|nr:cullin-like protein [Trifolium medium]
MASASSSAVQNPLNPLNLPQIMTIGKSPLLTGNVMQFDESLLKFCYDKMVDFESLKVNDFDVEELFLNQGWKRYFEMLNSPIFTNLVKEFWMKSKVYDDLAARMEEEQVVLKNPSLKGKTRDQMGLKAYNGTKIRSNIAGLDFTITKAHFAKLLSLEDRSKKISEYKNEVCYREAIKKELYEDKSMVGKSKGLKAKCLVLFKIFISSIVPRSGGTNTISWEHQHFIYFLLKGKQINLLDCLFENLCLTVALKIAFSARSGSCAAHSLCCAARSVCVVFVVFLLAAVPRTGVTCGACSVVVIVVGLFWFLCRAQAFAAPRTDPCW